ncbi:MAG TPA: hypothetical protein VL523_11095 [Terriglobia bacterium]|nr:hypothetical protein [Terriglobia bacterium]
MAVFAYLAEGVVTLLPNGYRRWYAPDEDLYRAAGVCGVLQYALCAGVLLTRFIAFMQSSMAGVGAAAVAHDHREALAGVQYHIGILYSTEFLGSPLTILLAYLMCEGLLRFLAAAVTREVIGTAPFYFVAWVWRWMRVSAFSRSEIRRASPQSLR